MDFITSALFEALKKVVADHGCKQLNKCRSCIQASIAIQAADRLSRKPAPVAESGMCRVIDLNAGILRLPKDRP